MASVRKTSQNSVHSGFLALIEKYWLVLIGLIVAVPLLLRYMKDAQTSDTVNNVEENIKLNVSKNLDPVKQQSALNAITTSVFYQDMARNVAANLGTLYQVRGGFLSWLNPRTWTENDQLIYNDLKLLKNSGQVKTVSNCYFFLTGKNLREDIIKLLDSELLAKLPLFR
jgi:predicted histidine transporter YuiF (NhaC family)